MLLRTETLAPDTENVRFAAMISTAGRNTQFQILRRVLLQMALGSDGDDPDDDHTLPVHGLSLERATDQFMFIVRKPR